jgi:hypothetical protein
MRLNKIKNLDLRSTPAAAEAAEPTSRVRGAASRAAKHVGQHKLGYGAVGASGAAMYIHRHKNVGTHHGEAPEQYFHDSVESHTAGY